MTEPNFLCRNQLFRVIQGGESHIDGLITALVGERRATLTAEGPRDAF